MKVDRGNRAFNVGGCVKFGVSGTTERISRWSNLFEPSLFPIVPIPTSYPTSTSSFRPHFPRCMLRLLDFKSSENLDNYGMTIRLIHGSNRQPKIVSYSVSPILDQTLNLFFHFNRIPKHNMQRNTMINAACCAIFSNFQFKLGIRNLQ